MIEDPDFYNALEAHLPGSDMLEVLDAGCGARFPFTLKRPAHITGVDVSPESMNRSHGLDEYIVGDIQTHRFSAKFDLIACMNVLEHVPHPENAIDNLASATRPGGVIVLGFPNPLSLKGLVTKFTPHSFHVFVLKHFFGFSKAGQKGYAPFPTYLRFSLATGFVLRRFRERGFDIVFVSELEGDQLEKLKEKSYLLYALYVFICRAGRILSLGSMRLDLSETLIVGKLRGATSGAASAASAPGEACSPTLIQPRSA